MRLRLNTLLIAIMLLAASYLYAQEGFPINSQTRIILNGGENISFEQFIEYTSIYDHELRPQFLADGTFELLNLYISETIKVTKTTEAVTPIVDYESMHIVESSNAEYTVVQELKNQKAPNFSVQAVDGTQLDLRNLRNNVVVLNFWFSKCAPCIEEMPHLNDLVLSYENKNVHFVGLAIEDQSATINFLNSKEFDFTIIPEAHKIAGQYKVQGYPTTIIIDRQGMVDDVFVGGMTDPFRVLGDAINKASITNVNDVSVELLRADEGLFFAESSVFDSEGNPIEESAFYDAIMNYECKIYKHIKNNKSIYYTLTKLNPK